MDGYQATGLATHELVPVGLINLNLPLSMRHKASSTLPVLLLPGPKQPKDYASFFCPLLEELGRLSTGIPAVDGETGDEFSLKAHVALVTGDGPAVASLMGMKRPGECLSYIWVMKTKANHLNTIR